jgi:hypothetical protein
LYIVVPDFSGGKLAQRLPGFRKNGIAYLQRHFIADAFYIPPEDKLLAEIKGEISGVNRNNVGYPNGMLIKCDLLLKYPVVSVTGTLRCRGAGHRSEAKTLGDPQG